VNESDVFTVALKLATPAERAAYLDKACAGNPQLRADVEALLRAHVSDPGFLEQPAGSLRETAELPLDHAERGGTPPDPGGTEQAGVVLAGRYKLLEAIGEGGMGTVWMAQQTEPVTRLVAVKLIKAGLGSKAVLARFGAERQALALMDHPNIAKVFDAGATDSGRPYFVMELVQGVPITRFCDERRLTPRQRLELFVPVCQAVQHAHQKGVIHRDLKPSNVLVALYDERPVPKVIDFGVAKAAGSRLTEGTQYTDFGAVIGTLEYMSPEQAEPNQLDIDTRSDVYSLGVLLYELLTGTTPLQRKRLNEAALLEALRLIREEEPQRPSTRLDTTEELPSIAANRGLEPRRLSVVVRGELDWLVMKCLEKDRNRRYETASGLALDLERYLGDEPVQACPPSALYRFGKFARRNKRALVSLSVLVLAGLLALGSLAVSNARISGEAREKTKALAAAKAAEQEAQHQSAVAKRERDIARRNLYVAHMNLAQAHWENANVSRVEELLDLYRRVEPGQEDLRGWEWYYQERLCHAYLRTLRGHESWILGVVFSRDGTRLATASRDGVAKVWDVATGLELRTFQGQKGGSVRTLAFSSDGTRLATGSEDDTVTLWDMASGKEVRTLQGKKGIIGLPESMAFSPDGTRLALGSAAGLLRVWDVADGKEVRTLWVRTSGHNILGVAFSPDGTRLAARSADQTVKVWDLGTGRELGSFQGSGPVGLAPAGVAFSADGTRLASGGMDRLVKLWDLASGHELHTFRGHTGWVASVAFSPDGTRLASASHDQMVKVWDVARGQELRTFRGHNNSVTAVAFSPDGTRLASGSSDTTVMLWEVGHHQEFRTLGGKLNVVTAVAFSPDGTLLASGSYSSVTISDVASGKALRTLPGGVNAVAFSPDGTHLATGGSHDRSIRLWDVARGEELHTLQGPRREVSTGEQINGLAFSPDGTRLASGSHHQAVKLWHVASGKELHTLQGGNMVWSVAFSRDGTRLAANDGPTVKLWDVASGKELRTLQGHKDQVVSVAFSPDGTRLASGGNDRTVKVWDVASGQELRTLRGHRGEAKRVAFSPDGTRLASGSNDYTVKVWDVASGQELRTLRHESLVDTVAFSPDGMCLATGSGGTVRLWDATPLTAQRRVEQEARGRLEFLFSRPLTKAEVITCLRGDAVISDAVRQQALDLVEHYARFAHLP
jgi:WD40 repeat protein/serine/threonine protein kinase